jgi:hypothetical protein
MMPVLILTLPSMQRTPIVNPKSPHLPQFLITVAVIQYRAEATLLDRFVASGVWLPGFLPIWFAFHSTSIHCPM